MSLCSCLCHLCPLQEGQVLDWFQMVCQADGSWSSSPPPCRSKKFSLLVVLSSAYGPLIVCSCSLCWTPNTDHRSKVNCPSCLFFCLSKNNLQEEEAELVKQSQSRFIIERQTYWLTDELKDVHTLLIKPTKSRTCFFSDSVK